jgi:Na+/H+ antiporter NhaC
MEALLIILLIGFVLCYFIRHPFKSIKYAFLSLTFLLVGYILIIGLFYLLMTHGANI